MGGEAGFTLVEVLVALALVAATLAAVGALVASNGRSARAQAGRLELAAAARTVMADLARPEIRPESRSGIAGRVGWRLDVLRRPPVAASAEDAPAPRWSPFEFVVTLREPGGSVMELRTLRLVRTSAP